MAGQSTTSVDVEIYGSVYHVRGEQGREYLLKLARIVDEKMREIGAAVPVSDTGKIAILAALNLADELLQSNQQQEGERVEIMEKVAELTGELTEALGARASHSPRNASRKASHPREPTNAEPALSNPPVGPR